MQVSNVFWWSFILLLWSSRLYVSLSRRGNLFGGHALVLSSWQTEQLVGTQWTHLSINLCWDMIKKQKKQKTKTRKCWKLFRSERGRSRTSWWPWLHRTQELLWQPGKNKSQDCSSTIKSLVSTFPCLCVDSKFWSWYLSASTNIQRRWSRDVPWSVHTCSSRSRCRPWCRSLSSLPRPFKQGLVF